MERDDVVPRTLAAPPTKLVVLAAGGAKAGQVDRERLLADLRAGAGPSKLTVEAVVFLQTEAPNRNFVRFKPSILNKLAKSFAGNGHGVPFLRDHEQRNLEARWGTVLASELVQEKDGQAIRQEIELVDRKAIEFALDGRIDRFSIGWSNTGDVVCSVCDEPMFQWSRSGCNHFPGDVVEAKDGTKQVVEMVVTGAEGVETSAVSVPAVKGTGIDGIRAALAAERGQAAKEKHMAIKFAAIAAALALSEEAPEEAIISGIGRLRADLEKITALHAAEAEAHATATRRVAELEGQLATVREGEKEATILRLLDSTRRKVGQKLGADGKPERGGTAHERAMLQLAARNLKEAEDFVAELPQILPIGQPLITRDKPPAPALGAATFSDEQLAQAKRMGLTAEDLAKFGPKPAREGK